MTGTIRWNVPSGERERERERERGIIFILRSQICVVFPVLCDWEKAELTSVVEPPTPFYGNVIGLGSPLNLVSFKTCVKKNPRGFSLNVDGTPTETFGGKTPFSPSLFLFVFSHEN